MLFFFQIAMDDFYIVFDDYKYWALPDEIFLDQIHDSLLDLYETPVKEGKKARDAGATAGVVIGSVIAGIIVCVAVGAVVFVRNTNFHCAVK